MKWSPQQQDAIATAAAWLRIRFAPWFYLAGYAGTGKTTLARHLASLQNGQVCYMAFTGKAAKVMRQHGCTGAKTIHSTIYDASVDHNTGLLTVSLKPPHAFEQAALFVVDESSMVNEDLARDLLSFGVPILVLGDPAQLPPVSGGGFFTAGKPHYMLTEVHRQAADSPIIRLATEVREGRWNRLPEKADGLTVTTRSDLDPAAVPGADAVIVGRNATRVQFNGRLRELAGFTGDRPMKGETVICLKNDRQLQIYNGEQFLVDEVKRDGRRAQGKLFNLVVVDPDTPDRKPVKVSVFEHFFKGPKPDLPFKALRLTHQFDFGYAITAHKAQGSQWPNVCVYDESATFREDAARWLYTAATRASKHLTLVI